MELPSDTREKLIWLYLLAPGFISVTIMGFIVDLGELSEFQITYYSLVLTVVDLAIAIGILWLLAITKITRATWGSGSLLICSLLISVVVGISLGFAAERDVLFVTLRSLPITKEINKRSAIRPTILLLSQNTRGLLKQEGDARPAKLKVDHAWVVITLKDGNKRYEGWPEFYGLGRDSAAEIYLSPACEVTTKGGKDTLHKVRGPGVILYESEIKSITLIDRACSPCYLRWNPQTVPKDESWVCSN